MIFGLVACFGALLSLLMAYHTQIQLSKVCPLVQSVWGRQTQQWPWASWPPLSWLSCAQCWVNVTFTIFILLYYIFWKEMAVQLLSKLSKHSLTAYILYLDSICSYGILAARCSFAHCSDCSFRLLAASNEQNCSLFLLGNFWGGVLVLLGKTAR